VKGLAAYTGGGSKSKSDKSYLDNELCKLFNDTAMADLSM